MMYCHRSMLKSWCNSSTPGSFRNSSSQAGGGGGGLLLGGGGGCFEKASPFSPIRHYSYSSPHSPLVSPPSPLLMVPPGVTFVDQSRETKWYNQYHPNRAASNNKNNEDYFHFLSLTKQNKFRVRKNLSIPWQRDLLTPDGARCASSSHGWLAFNHPHNCHPYLYNPLIDSPHFPYIPLPSIETLPSVRAVRLFKSDHRSPSPSIITRFQLLNKTFLSVDGDESVISEHNVSTEQACHFYLHRLAMSSAPSFPSSSSKPNLDDQDCTIMAIHGGFHDIAFCKPGNDRWTVLDGSRPPYSDIVYFSKDQRFYAINSDCSMEAWDLRDPSCPKIQVFDGASLRPGKLGHQLRLSYNCVESNYLVESSGDLLLLSRFVALSVAESGIHHPESFNGRFYSNLCELRPEDKERNYYIRDDDAYWTLGFDVHKLDYYHGKWEPVDCLGERALFVGSNHSFSLSTRDYPELIENSIYFSDDNFEEFNDVYHGHDNGIFSLGDDDIERFYPARLKIIDPHPVWVAPLPPTQCSST